MHTHQLTNELFNDLLDPRIPTLDVCRRHAIPITDLRLILASDHFQQSAQALIEAEQLRAAALAPDRRERALATLDAITQQQPSTPTHTECIRRAASAILRAATPKASPGLPGEVPERSEGGGGLGTTTPVTHSSDSLSPTSSATSPATALEEIQQTSSGLQQRAGEVPERSEGGGGSRNHQTPPGLQSPTTSEIPEPSASSA